MFRILGYILLFLMLGFPMALSLLYVKAAMFGALLVILFIRALLDYPVNLHPKIFIGTLVFTSISLIFCLEGFLRGTPGAAQCAQVYVFWPLVYLFLLTGVGKETIFSGLENTMIFSTAFIGVFGVLFFLSAVGAIPPIPFASALLSNDELSSGLYSGHVELAFPGINSLPFLVPFVLAVVLTRQKRRLWPWMALLVALPVVILSGRRALQIVTMLSPLLVYAACCIQPSHVKKSTSPRILRTVVIVLLLIAASISVFGYFSEISVAGLGERLSAGFDFSNSMDTSASARTEQYLALTKSIQQRPFFGAGFGAADFHSVRSEAMPWAYELYYIALIFQTGLVGFAAYATGMLWIYRSAAKIIRIGEGQQMIPAMVGMTAMLIATATNPYLVRFDGLWVIFLPLALINHWLVKNETRAERDTEVKTQRSFLPGSA